MYSASKQYERLWLCYTLEVAREDIVIRSFFLSWRMLSRDPECKKKQVLKIDGWLTPD